MASSATAPRVGFRVINLEHRSDRLAAFRAHCASAHGAPDIAVSPGVPHAVPHVGCGLAHAAAALGALEDPTIDGVCVFEDDARLRDDKGVTWADVLAALDAALQPGVRERWDALVLAVGVEGSRPLPDAVFDEHAAFVRCSPCTALHQGTAMVWQRTAVPFLRAYAARLRARPEPVPIDRVMHARLWNAWGPFDLTATVPPQRTLQAAQHLAPIAFDADISVQGADEPVPAHLAPRVWVHKSNLFYQALRRSASAVDADVDVSDNTRQRNVDTRVLDDKGLRALVRKAAAA